MSKKTIFAILLILSVLIIIRPREETLLRCAMFGPMKLFSSDTCMVYFDVFGYSENVYQDLRENFDIASLLSLSPERKYYFAQLYLDSGNDINQKLDQGMPIHGAILKDDLEEFYWLLEKNANPSIVDPLTDLDAYDFIDIMINKQPTPNRLEMHKVLDRYKQSS
ncbi:TPA: hypothetical protein RQJ64_004066 [Vibrio vulnificus]|nr:hypothetical protein [Vibrio vulnificus]HDY7507091.1 hypothetical protein [Vibrio vulnificus]